MIVKSKGRRASACNAVFLSCCVFAACTPPVRAAPREHPLISLMQDEMKLSMEKLVSPEGTKPYYIQYLVVDSVNVGVSATLGAVVSQDDSRSRQLDVGLRCGDYKIDSTRQIRDSDIEDYSADGSQTLPLSDDPLATRQAIWVATDDRFRAAVKRLAQVRANLKVKVEEEDPSDDFSIEEPTILIDEWIKQPYDKKMWTERVREHSRRFREHPEIFSSSVALSGNIGNNVGVNSEGSRVQYGVSYWRIGIQASTIADDGMELSQYRSFDAHSPEGLPSVEVVDKAVDQVISELLALRKAPIVDPYTGPAILMNRASGVFFHEIFGHRIEGHRQKNVEEGQTFAKKIGKDVLPSFLDVVDDPTQKVFKGVDLNGWYPVDDECVRAQPAHLVERGILKTFLLSRSPTRGFTKSNGHGRCSAGSAPVSRQGNLTVKSSKRIAFEKLRQMLIAEAKKQGKEYGLLFRDISGGQTNTNTYDPQAFQVMPILVYRVFADGKPDELVRGVNICGTPLTCFSKILATADDEDVFNGYCGAESGWVPVSAISPSILVEQIEIEKQHKAQDRPPILPAPISEDPTSVAKKSN